MEEVKLFDGIKMCAREIGMIVRSLSRCQEALEELERELRQRESQLLIMADKVENFTREEIRHAVEISIGLKTLQVAAIQHQMIEKRDRGEVH